MSNFGKYPIMVKEIREAVKEDYPELLRSFGIRKYLVLTKIGYNNLGPLVENPDLHEQMLDLMLRFPIDNDFASYLRDTSIEGRSLFVSDGGSVNSAILEPLPLEEIHHMMFILFCAT